jgi:hypothetical protein
MLELGTFLLRTESELVFKSRQVVPGRLFEAGFQFKYPTWPEVAHDLVVQWRGPIHEDPETIEKSESSVLSNAELGKYSNRFS